MKVTVTLELNNGKKKHYQLRQTQEAVKGAKGNTLKAIFQPAEANKVLLHYGKVYVDTIELAKDKS